MCKHQDVSVECDAKRLNRRRFVKLAGLFALGLGLSRPGFASETVSTPKPQNAISPDEALERLIAGNERYVTGTMKAHDFVNERPTLIRAQNPFAGILSCSDSRVAPEYAFDTGRGDLFVCRLAGNFANKETIASFEYTVAVLGTPLLVVLGHKGCGAVEATIKAVTDGETFPGHIPSLINALRPAVEAARKISKENLLDNAIKQNVIKNVAALNAATPIISKAIEEKKLRVVGGMYNLDTGRVDFFA